MKFAFNYCLKAENLIVGDHTFKPHDLWGAFPAGEYAVLILTADNPLSSKEDMIRNFRKIYNILNEYINLILQEQKSTLNFTWLRPPSFVKHHCVCYVGMEFAAEFKKALYQLQSIMLSVLGLTQEANTVDANTQDLSINRELVEKLLARLVNNGTLSIEYLSKYVGEFSNVSDASCKSSFR